MDEQIKKIWTIYTMEYYSAIKKNKNIVIWDNMINESTGLNEINQTQKDKYYIISLTCGVCVCVCVCVLSKLMDTENKSVVTSTSE